jgi:hypothetical protein
MAINFPTSPTTNYVHSENNLSWKFDGIAWVALPADKEAGRTLYKDDISDATSDSLIGVDRVFISNRNNAPFKRDTAGVASTYPAQAKFTSGGQDWILDIDDEVHVEWLGAKGDCAKVTYSDELPSSGTDNSDTFFQARQLCQLLSKDSFYGGDAAMVYLTLSPRRYYVKGDNPLGTTFRRTGATQNLTLAYGIRGNGALIYWEVDNQNDTCIASHETMTWQQYEDFSVFPCGITAGTSGSPNFIGKFYTNEPDEVTPYGANTQSNHRFQNVQCVCNFQSADRPYTGLYRMFSYVGSVKGEGLRTNNCKFSGYETGYYVDNQEAVHHSFKDTFWASYADDVIHFHVKGFGSGMTVDGGGCLMKGDNHTLLRNWGDTNSGNGAINTYITFNNLRVEAFNTDGVNATYVYANKSQIEFNSTTGLISGVPASTSIQYHVEDSAVLTVKDSMIWGRVTTGLRNTNVGATNNFGIRLDGAVFVYDASEQIGYYDGTTFTKSSTASAGTVTADEFPMVLVENTKNKGVYYSSTGGAIPTLDYTFCNDFVYNYNMKSGSSIPKYTAKLWDTRGSVGYSYPYLKGGESLGVLPAGALVTSIKLSAISQSGCERVKVYVGSVLCGSLDLTLGTLNKEMLDNQLVYVNGAITDREVTVVLSDVSDTPFTGSSRGTVSLDYQPTSGILESGGVSATTKTRTVI